MTPSPDVAEVFAGAKLGPDCWRTRPHPPAVEQYLSAVEEHMKATGQNPTWTRLADKLTDLGEVITADKLRHHFQKRCRCYRGVSR